VITNTHEVRLLVRKRGAHEFGYKTMKNMEIEHFNCGNKEIGEKKIVIKHQLQNAALCGMCNGLLFCMGVKLGR